VSSIQITYHLNSDSSKEVTEAIRVEQTIEFPFDLAPEWIQEQVVGQVVSSLGHCFKTNGFKFC